MPERGLEPSPSASAPKPPPEGPPPLAEKTLTTIDEDGPAWERRQHLGLFKALTQTWKEILFNPTVGFARMKTSGGVPTHTLFDLDRLRIFRSFACVFLRRFCSVLCVPRPFLP